MKALYERYKEEMRHLQYHRKRQDEKNYWATWDKLVEMKRQFLALNGPGEHWD